MGVGGVGAAAINALWSDISKSCDPKCRCRMLASAAVGNGAHTIHTISQKPTTGDTVSLDAPTGMHSGDGGSENGYVAPTPGQPTAHTRCGMYLTMTLAQ